MKKLTIFLICIISFSILADEYSVFPMFAQTGSVQQFSFNGGGSTLPAKISGASLNPASLYAYHKQLGKRIGFGGSYQNDLDGKILTGGGVSYALDTAQVIGMDYQLFDHREGDAPMIHRGVLSYSSLIREVSAGEFISWGFNMNYINNNGLYNSQDSLNVIQYVNDTVEQVSSYTTGVGLIDGYYQAVSLDVGFFNIAPPRPFWQSMGWQPLFSESYTYSVVLENLVGYRWDKREDGIVTESNSIDDTTRVDSLYYNGETVKTTEWLQGRYKSFLFGLALHRQVMGDNVILSVPIDVRFWGFMDKDLRKNSEWKNRTMLRVGMNANILNKVRLRCGYSWAPLEYQTLDDEQLLFRNKHQISGGFSLTLGPVELDAGFKKGEFAFGGSFYL